MKDANEYLRRAAEADGTAAKAADPAVRRQWTDLADQWRALARQSGLFAGDASGPAVRFEPPQKL